MVLSAHVSDLLTELAELKANGGLASLPKEEEEEGKHKGVMADRFTKESVEKEADAIVNLLERNESEEAKEDNGSSSETP